MALRLDNVSKSFGDVRVLDGVTFAFPERGLVGVSGPSGAGKTTLLRIIAGLERPDSGRVVNAPNRVSVQFEDDRLFPWMDAAANVELVGCDRGAAAALLAELGLEGRAHARIAELSGGQRRRLALARALAFDAPVYLLDEPTARLDAGNAALVLDAVCRRADDALVIMATHDPQALERCGDRIIDLAGSGVPDE